MRNGQLLFSAIQFLFIAALFGLGAVFFSLHYFPQMRLYLADWILEPGETFFSAGLVVSATAAFLTLCFFIMQRGSFIRIKMEKGDLFIEEDAVRLAVEQFWKETYPEEKKPSEIYCAGKKIEIITEDQNQDLESLEITLANFLSTQFGYEREYFITLTRK